jgi:RNA polymerase sigma-70 factor (ECF subfamily)
LTATLPRGKRVKENRSDADFGIAHKRVTDPTDAELIGLARGGDLGAYGILVRRHHARVAGLCFSLLENRSDVDDAVQEIFLKAYRSLDGFHGDAQFSTWLYRISVNECHDVKRRNARRRTVSLDAIVDDQGDSAGSLLKEPAPRTDKAEETELTERLIARLPAAYRDALVLRAQGLSYEQIAATLACTVDAVKARLRRARRRLSENLRHVNAPAASKRELTPESHHGSRGN